LTSSRIALVALALTSLFAIAAPTAAADWQQPPLTLEESGDLGGEVEVVADSAGRSTVAWRDENGAKAIFRFRRVEADGTLGPTGDLSSVANGDSRDLELDVAPNGEVVAVWSQGMTFETEQIRMRRIAPDGSVGTIQVLSAQDASFPDVDMNQAFAGYVVWQRDDGVEVEVEGRALLGGGVLGPVREFSTAVDDATGALVAMNENGTALVIWRYSVEEGVLTGAIATLSGVPGVSFPLGGGEDQIRTPAVAVRPDGGFLVLFSLTTGAPQFEEAVQRRTVSAAGVASAVADVSEYGDSAGNTTVAVDPSGVATAVWRYRKDGPESLLLQARRINPDGGLGPLVPAVSAKQTPQTVEVGVDAIGNVTVVWDRENPLFEVLTRRLLADGTLEPATDLILAAPDAANPREAAFPALGVSPGGAALTAFVRSGGGQPSDQVQALRFVPTVPGGSQPSNRFRFGKLKRNKKKGTATLIVIVPGPGALALGKSAAVKGAVRSAQKAGRVKLPIRLRGRARRRLSRLAETRGIGRVKVKVRVTFTPTGGTALTLTKRLTMVRRSPGDR
jgi:hypothetical protein